jgi:hypothetical protein
MPTEELPQIPLGAINSIFEGTFKDNGVVVPVDEATVLQLKFRKPDGATTVTKTAVLSTTGLDGKIRYTTVDVNDLDQVGTWKIQGYVEMPEWTGHTKIKEFEVFANL